MAEEDIKKENISTSQDAELLELLKKNLALTEEIAHATKGLHGWLVWQRVWSIIKIIIIVIPLAIGIIYLPPLLKTLVSQYQELLGITANPAQGLLDASKSGIDIDSLPDAVKKYIK